MNGRTRDEHNIRSIEPDERTAFVYDSRKVERWDEIDHWRALHRPARDRQRESVPDARHPVTDDSLTGYAPAVREALARRTSLTP